jgi:hypothetical protein
MDKNNIFLRINKIFISLVFSLVIILGDLSTSTIQANAAQTVTAAFNGSVNSTYSSTCPGRYYIYMIQK